MNSRAAGIAIAFVTACISGVSIWLNGRALAHFTGVDASVYTTAKVRSASTPICSPSSRGEAHRSARS